MLTYLLPAIRFIFFGNFFIAFCASVQVLVTYKIFNIKPNIFIQSILFFATLSVYNLSLIFNKPNKNKIYSTEKARWAYKHYHLNVAITIISALSLIPLIFMIGFKAQILLALLALISCAYTFPVFDLDGKKFSLRQIRGLKIFLIALVWSLGIVYLPILEANEMVGKTLFLRWLEQFLFIFAITIPFDVKDFNEDKIRDIKTIPVLYGNKLAYNISIILVFIIFFVALIGNKFRFDMHLSSYLITLIITVLIIYKSKNAKSELYYYIFLDGTLIIQIVLLFLFNNGYNQY